MLGCPSVLPLLWCQCPSRNPDLAYSLLTSTVGYPICHSSTLHSERGHITKVFHVPICRGPALIALALYGSRYLEHLITNNFVKLTPSPILDELYAAGLIHPDRTKSRAAAVPTKEEAGHVAKVVERQSSDDTEEVMLLKKWNGKLLAERLELPEMEVEIERAVEQVEKDIESQEKLRRNKAELERVAAAQDKNKPL